MAGSVNKAILVGNLGRDPEVRFANDGSKIVNFSIATSESWKDRQTGERRERTEWHRIVIFNERLADVAERFLRKGTTVYIEGMIKTRKWTDQSGTDKYTTEIVLPKFQGELTMLGPRRGGPQGEDDYGTTSSGGGPEWNSGGSENQGNGAPGGDLDDEIPF